VRSREPQPIRDTGAGQFIHKTVSILVHAKAESFFRLHSVVVVASVIRELEERDDVGDLMEWPDN
jgi:hypothetical protein